MKYALTSAFVGAFALLACDSSPADAPAAALPSGVVPGPAAAPGVDAAVDPIDLARPGAPGDTPTALAPIFPEDGPARVRALVRFAPDADRAAALRFLDAAGARVTYAYRLVPDLIAVRALPTASIAALEQIAGVAKVVPDQVRHADLAQSKAVMHASPAEMTGFSSGAGVRVCVLDTGINQTHPAFAGAIVAQKDFVGDDNVAQDDNGHGTNVAGIVASRDAVNGGVAPGASLVIGKVLAANGSGYDSDIIAAIDWCTLDAHAAVSNMSLGGGKYFGTCDWEPLAAAVNASVDAGVVHVVAAGNEGNSNATGAPACARRAIAVGAVYDATRGGGLQWCLNSTCTTTCTDSGIVPDKITCFSNRSMKVSVSAPGSEITAPDAFGNGFSAESGTSQATPHVAGLIARLIGERPELRPNHVRDLVSGNATDLGAVGFDVAYGHGRVDALATLEDPTAITCTAPADCNDGDSCTRDTCESGFCAHRAKCDDGDATTADTCDAATGACTHGALSANDNRACTTDTLDACVGPRYTTNGGACNATCANGVPLPFGVAVAGTTSGASNSINSSCPGFAMPGLNTVYKLWMRPDQAVTFTLTNSASWDPALYLLTGSSATACDTSRCVAGMDLLAGSAGETMARVRVPVEGWYFLVVDTFSSTATGAYTIKATVACDPEDEGLACDDGNACTANDQCVSGACVAGPVAGGCGSDADCSDGDQCNGAEQCVAGACKPGTPPNCDDHQVCTLDTCHAATGCAHIPVANGTGCADGTVCNGAETCQSGVCTAGVALACGDGNACTTDSCDPVAGCRNVAVPNGTACGDGDPCNGDDTCQGGQCAIGAVPDCDDHDPCTSDRCDAGLGCGHNPLPDTTSCDDGNVCNGVEACRSGACVAGGAPTCNDGNPCTVDSCDPTLGCRATPAANGASCSDGNACNGAETCQAGACQGGAAPSCDDGNPCTVDTCSPVAGCVHDVAGKGTTCDDGNACTTGEQCSAGVCGGGVDTCSPGYLAIGIGGSQVTLPGGTVVANEDLARYDIATRAFAQWLDGSDVGLGPTSIAGLAFLANGDLALSFNDVVSLPGLVGGPNGTFVEPRDIVRFTPSSLGAMTTGTWTFMFDGSDVGLTQAAESIDALEVLPDGSILLSTIGSFAVPGVSGTAHDIVRFVPTTQGAATTGTWSMYFDGSDVGLSLTAENVDALAVLADGTLLVSTTGNFAVPGLSGANEDVIRFTPGSLGGVTTGTWSLYFDGSAVGFSDDVRALDWRQTP